jgi:hypothetical protein
MAKRMHQVTFGPGVPGMKTGYVKGVMATGITKIMAALEKHRAVSDAGDHGWVMVWRDDAGAYRGAFMVWMSTRASTVVTSKAALRRWLREFLPKQRQQ